MARNSFTQTDPTLWSQLTHVIAIICVCHSLPLASAELILCQKDGICDVTSCFDFSSAQLNWGDVKSIIDGEDSALCSLDFKFVLTESRSGSPGNADVTKHATQQGMETQKKIFCQFF